MYLCCLLHQTFFPHQMEFLSFICIIIFSLLLYRSRYIEENYSKIRDVEKEFANLSMEMKLTAGPKKAGL